MDYFGINSADDLPKIREVLAEQMIEPTIIQHTEFEENENTPETREENNGPETEEENPIFSVAENGELVEKKESGGEEVS